MTVEGFGFKYPAKKNFKKYQVVEVFNTGSELDGRWALVVGVAAVFAEIDFYIIEFQALDYPEYAPFLRVEGDERTWPCIVMTESCLRKADVATLQKNVNSVRFSG
jgi:hypothetical protein